MKGLGSVNVARGAKSTEGERPRGLGTHTSSMRGRTWHGGVHRLAPVHGGPSAGSLRESQGQLPLSQQKLNEVWMCVVCVVWQMFLGEIEGL